MPPRIVIVLIIGSWLASLGWLSYHEWWPWLRADSPPPFTVKLADEATPLVAHWSIWRGEHKIGTALTRMTVQKNDTFELYSSIENLELTISSFGLTVVIKVPRQTTVQRVTRKGELLAIASNTQINLAVLGQEYDMKSAIDGTVNDGKLYARSRLESSLFGKVEQELEPITLSSGSMLNPMQPIANLDVPLGKRWKITNVNPLEEVVNATMRQAKIGIKLGVGAPKILLAEVRPEAEKLTHRGTPISCHVIDYRSDDVVGQTWVQASDGKVLKQEVAGMGEKLVLLRED